MSWLKESKKALLSAGVSVFISFIMTLSIFYRLPYQFYADDGQYYEIAKSFLENNFFSYHTGLNIRTYLYPYLLSFIYNEKISHFLINLALIQWVVFVASAWLFCRFVFVSDKLKRYCFAILICNPLLLAYACHALTDLLYTSFILVSLGFLFKSIYLFQSLPDFYPENKITRQQNIKLLVCCGLGALFTGGCIAIRPAGIFMIPVIFITNTYLMWGLYQKTKNIMLPIGLALVCLLFFVLPLLPQLILNKLFFDKLTFLPPVGLGSQQLIWGLQYLKYGTNFSGIGTPQMYYLNPFVYLWDENISPVKWYLEHPLIALKIFFFKFIGAFHFDYLHPYVKNLSSPLYPITTSISIFVLLFGGIGVFVKRKLLETKLIILPVLFFWCVITLPSAIELRFTLPMIAILSVYSIFGLKYIYELPCLRTKIIWLLICTMLYLGFQSAGHFVFMQNSNFKLYETGLKPIQINNTVLHTPAASNWLIDIKACEIKNDRYFIQGWFSFKEQENISNTTMTLLIENKGKFFSLKTNQILKTDVTKRMNELSEFSASLSKNFNIEAFNIYLLVEDANSKQILIKTNCIF